MEIKPLHYWRIHARVTRRVWSDMTIAQREVVAADDTQTSDISKWFVNKVNADTQRLFEDPAYYDNDPYSFKVPRS